MRYLLDSCTLICALENNKIKLGKLHKLLCEHSLLLGDHDQEKFRQAQGAGKFGTVHK